MKKTLLAFLLSWLIFTNIYATSDSPVEKWENVNKTAINDIYENEIEAKYKEMYAEKIKYLKNELKQDWKIGGKNYLWKSNSDWWNNEFHKWNFHNYRWDFGENNSHFNKWWKWSSWHWVAGMIWFVIFKIMFWILFVSTTTFLVRRVWECTWKSDFLKFK